MFKTEKFIVFPLLLLMLSPVAAFAVQVTGVMPQPDFRDGVRVQFSTKSGSINAIFRMSETDNDDMLVGGPSHIKHCDFTYAQAGNWEANYDMLKSYVVISAYNTGVCKINFVQK